MFVHVLMVFSEKSTCLQQNFKKAILFIKNTLYKYTRGINYGFQIIF